jgi:glycerol-3-phosphate acyltransferase PlsY
MLAPFATAIAALVFAVTIFVTRFISAGSIAGALALAVVTFAVSAPGPIVAGAVAAALLVTHRHRDNLLRLIAGTERRIGLRL